MAHAASHQTPPPAWLGFDPQLLSRNTLNNMLGITIEGKQATRGFLTV